MKLLSQRRAFTSLMSVLATAFVIVVWRQKFSYQSDFLGDIIKVSVCIAISTAIVSFVMWTLTHLRQAPFKNKALARGALAGGLTALIIIPLPTSAWVFKTEFLSAYHAGDTGLFSAAFEAGFLGVKLGLGVFIEITKAALVAIIGSIAVGMGVTHYFNSPAKTLSA